MIIATGNHTPTLQDNIQSLVYGYMFIEACSLAILNTDFSTDIDTDIDSSTDTKLILILIQS